MIHRGEMLRTDAIGAENIPRVTLTEIRMCQRANNQAEGSVGPIYGMRFWLGKIEIFS